MDFSEIRAQSAQATALVCDAAQLAAGNLMVVGCSSSEICGEKIGTHASLDAADAVFSGIYEVLHARSILLAAQCCEHLNRALVVERDTCVRFHFTEVNAVPQPHAGGSFASTAYARFASPVVVETLAQQASAGMDIGCTLIGMHLRPVVVPLRIAVPKIGCAHLICARSRPKFIGGSRAVYNENLL